MPYVWEDVCGKQGHRLLQVADGQGHRVQLARARGAALCTDTPMSDRAAAESGASADLLLTKQNKRPILVAVTSPT